jgi:hypothetical protein
MRGVKTRCCYYCKWRQRTYSHPLLDCVKHDKSVKRGDKCPDWEWRWGNNPSEDQFKKEYNSKRDGG